MNLVDYFQDQSDILNENKYFIGLMMIMVNIGARFIIDELDDDLRKIVSQSFVRRFFIFCSFFMATRDVFTAFILTVVFVIIINEFLGKEEEESDKNGSSFNKEELGKSINKLKEIQSTM